MTKEEQALLQKWRDNRGISMEDFEDAMNALQEPCDDTVSIRKDVLKCRVGKLVVYNVEWLKKHWQMEMDIVCGVKPCDNAISREAVMGLVAREHSEWDDLYIDIAKLPSVTPEQKPGKCKNCKYFEYDSVAKVDGVPLIVAHEICNKWGDGCKTKEDGYCFLFEPPESEDKE